MSVSLRELEAGVLKKARLYVEVKAGKGTETIELVPTSYNTFSNHFRLREGFHDLRVVMVRSDQREFAMIGFNVVSTLPLLSGKDTELWFVAQGRFEAIPWIDNISGILVAVMCLAAIVWLVRRKQIQTTMGSRTTPVFVLAIASISAVAMPVGGYWDISFHSESGRETVTSQSG